MPRQRLAIFTPHLGGETDTFIQKHVQRLCPGRTVVVASDETATFGKPWKSRCPKLILEGIALEHQSRLMEKFFCRHRVSHCLGEHLDYSLWVWPIAKKLGIRFFAHAHGSDMSAALRDRKFRERYRSMYSAYGEIITVSRLQKRLLVKLGIPARKIHVIPCGTDLPGKLPCRKPGPLIRCIAVGRFEPVKGSLLILESFRRALRSNPSLRLEYIGTGTRWRLAQEYVAKHRLEKFITLSGQLPNSRVRKLLRKADIYLHHSIVAQNGCAEGLPVSLLEAMAEGLPVISSRHSGIPEAVVHGKTGLLSPEKNTKEMAENIVRLSRTPSLRARMGGNGSARAQKLFSWEKERTELLRVMGLNSGRVR